MFLALYIIISSISSKPNRPFVQKLKSVKEFTSFTKLLVTSYY